MNAAFLLVATALVGQPATPPPATTVPAPAHAVPAAAACGTNGCHDPCGCDSFGHRLRGRLGGLFNRGGNDACQPTCCNSGHGHSHSRGGLFNRGGGCGDDCGRARWSWTPITRSHDCCAPTHCAPANTCSDACDRGNFLGRLRGIFRRGGNDCCHGGVNTGCANNACGSAPVGIAPIGPATIDGATPKKMPEPIKKAPSVTPPTTPKGNVSIEPAPNAIPPVVTPNAGIPNVPVTAPSVEIAPAPITAPAPRVDGDRRDPF